MKTKVEPEAPEITRDAKFWEEMEERKAEILARRDEQKAEAFVRADRYREGGSLNTQMARCLGGIKVSWRERLRLKKLWEPFTWWIERHGKERD